MARPTSCAGTSADPVQRIASSTAAASWANWSSSTGRPWHARRTPATTLERLNGSLTPLRLTTASTASSTVVNRRWHWGHERRRRVVAPSSASRESVTRLSGLWQKGHRTADHLRLEGALAGGGRPPAKGLLRPSGRRSVDSPGDIRWMPRGEPEDRLWTGLHPCNY